MIARLLRGKDGEVLVKYEDRGISRICSLEEWNSKLKVPIVPPENWRA